MDSTCTAQHNGIPHAATKGCLEKHGWLEAFLPWLYVLLLQ
jgi:hypothetical protein